MIPFKVKEPREYLLSHDVVYTIRDRTIRTGQMTAMFNGDNLGEVSVEKVLVLTNWDDVLPYVRESGFKDEGEWREAFLSFRRKDRPLSDFAIFKVTVLRE